MSDTELRQHTVVIGGGVAGLAAATDLARGGRAVTDHPNGFALNRGSHAPQLERQVAATVPVHIACLDVALERLPSSRAPVVFDMQQHRFITAQSTVAVGTAQSEKELRRAA
jgi:phytoene dehydrogenase-like protein